MSPQPRGGLLRRSWRWWAVALVAILTVGALVGWVFRALPSAPDPSRPTASSSSVSNASPSTGPVEGLGVRLEVHEKLGGHTLARHVGKSAQELAARLQREPTLTAASTFTDRAVAEQAITATVQANQAQINAWLHSGGGKAGSAFTHRMPHAVGLSVRRADPAPRPAFTVRVVLRPSVNQATGYRILTAYPE